MGPLLDDGLARDGANSLQLQASLLVDLGEQVSVVVVGERDRRVARASRDLGGVDSGESEQGNSRVLQIVRS